MKSKFERINRLPPYIFSEINGLKMKLRSEKRDIIDFGMGNPDMPTPLHIRQKLKETIDKPGVGRYSVSRGIIGLRKAQSNYYKRRFNVDLDYNKEEIKFSDLELIFKDLKTLFEKRGFIINWKELEKQSLDEIINALAMASPFSLEEKQALLETENFNTRKNKIG